MKKILLLGCLSIILISCSSDDSVPLSETDDLLGLWKLTEWNTETAFDINNDGIANTNLLEEIDCLDNETITFNSSNTAFVDTSSSIDIEVFVETGTTDSFVFDVDCDFETDSFVLNWNRTENQVFLIEEDFEDEPLIAQIDGNTLTFTLNDALVVYDDNFEVEFTEDFTIVYTKQE
ncbi:hypothetical protein [Winogradskyella aurantiaca]|uniref:hypothetical protein n=1 Tax=Winogradskyella aurantiaca TaxID=2219558 RepID=UPI000E1DC98C|nr:hypothetical protein [Winogradskyella aurantiaca]